MSWPKIRGLCNRKRHWLLRFNWPSLATTIPTSQAMVLSVKLSTEDMNSLSVNWAHGYKSNWVTLWAEINYITIIWYQLRFMGCVNLNSCVILWIYFSESHRLHEWTAIAHVVVCSDVTSRALPPTPGFFFLLNSRIILVIFIRRF